MALSLFLLSLGWQGDGRLSVSDRIGELAQCRVVSPPLSSWPDSLEPAPAKIFPRSFSQKQADAPAMASNPKENSWYQDAGVHVIAACGVVLICFWIGILTNRHLALEHLIEERTSELKKAYNINLKYQEELHWIATELSASEERIQRRIGQDLHDGLGQNLTGIGMLMKSLQRKLAAKSLPEADEMDRLMRHLSDTIQKTRDLAKVLCPVSLEKQGLIMALQELAEEMRELYEIPCRFQWNPSVEFHNPDFSLHLYRIAQEALNNAVKHSQATSLDMVLEIDGGRYYLLIRDNGEGIGARAAHTEGMGVKLMFYRANLIKGSLEVTNRPEGGTDVRCYFKDSAPKSSPDDF
ncbi:MAG: sensor histidine kinase [Candidatus Omnitrophota bacterium]